MFFMLPRRMIVRISHILGLRQRVLVSVVVTVGAFHCSGNRSNCSLW